MGGPPCCCYKNKTEPRGKPYNPLPPMATSFLTTTPLTRHHTNTHTEPLEKTIVVILMTVAVFTKTFYLLANQAEH